MKSFIDRARKGFAFALLAALGIAAIPARGAAVYTILDLATLGGTLSGTSGYNVLNASGQVVGGSTTTSPRYTIHAFRTAANSPIVPGAGGSDLGTFRFNDNDSYALGINASGQAVGYSIYIANDGNGSYHAFRTSANGPIVNGASGSDLGTLGGSTSVASGINASGQAVGCSSIPGVTPTGSDALHAFRTTANGPIVKGAGGSDLGSLGGDNSYAVGINVSGQTVGYSDITGNAATHAFRTAANGPIVEGAGGSDLGTLGGTTSFGYGINASGQAVGYSLTTGNADQHAFFADVTGPMVDLNTLIDPASGWVLFEARGINDSGQIAGTGRIGGQIHAYLITPTPEPASLAVLAVGGMAFLRRNRRRSA